jgi:hypothetical protein
MITARGFLVLGSAPRTMCFLAAIPVAMLSVSSVGEARHGRAAFLALSVVTTRPGKRSPRSSSRPIVDG